MRQLGTTNSASFFPSIVQKLTKCWATRTSRSGVAQNTAPVAPYLGKYPSLYQFGSPFGIGGAGATKDVRTAPVWLSRT